MVRGVLPRATDWIWKFWLGRPWPLTQSEEDARLCVWCSCVCVRARFTCLLTKREKGENRAHALWLQHGQPCSAYTTHADTKSSTKKPKSLSDTCTYTIHRPQLTDKIHNTLLDTVDTLTHADLRSELVVSTSATRCALS